MTNNILGDMLSTKENICPDYSEVNFEKELWRTTKIINKYSLVDQKDSLWIRNFIIFMALYAYSPFGFLNQI